MVKLTIPMLIRRFYPVWIVLGVIGLGGGVLAATALFHKMDVLTYVASLQTPQVTVTDLRQGKLNPVILIDVRSPDEYAQDHIGDSKLVPLTDLEMGFGIKQVQEIANSTKRQGQKPTLVLYCTAGARSVQAYQLLRSTGLNLVVLKGGIEQWRRQIPVGQDNLLPLLP